MLRTLGKARSLALLAKIEGSSRCLASVQQVIVDDLSRMRLLKLSDQCAVRVRRERREPARLWRKAKPVERCRSLNFRIQRHADGPARYLVVMPPPTTLATKLRQ